LVLLLICRTNAGAAETADWAAPQEAGTFTRNTGEWPTERGNLDGNTVKPQMVELSICLTKLENELTNYTADQLRNPF